MRERSEYKPRSLWYFCNTTTNWYVQIVICTLFFLKAEADSTDKSTYL